MWWVGADNAQTQAELSVLICPHQPFLGLCSHPIGSEGRRAGGSGRGSLLRRESSHPPHPTPKPAPRVRSSQSFWLFSIQPSFPDMKGPDAPPPPRSSQKACLRLARGSPETPSWASHHSLARGAGTAPTLASLRCIRPSLLFWNKYIGTPVWRSMHLPLAASVPWAPR